MKTEQLLEEASKAVASTYDTYRSAIRQRNRAVVAAALDGMDLGKISKHSSLDRGQIKYLVEDHEWTVSAGGASDFGPIPAGATGRDPVRVYDDRGVLIWSAP